MGTASLALGIGLIVSGFGYFLISMAVPWLVEWLDIIIISIPLIVVGAFFLRKHDRDKKKDLENKPIQNNEPEKKDEKMSKSEYQKTIIVVVGLTIAFILIIALSS